MGGHSTAWTRLLPWDFPAAAAGDRRDSRHAFGHRRRGRPDARSSRRSMIVGEAARPRPADSAGLVVALVERALSDGGLLLTRAGPGCPCFYRLAVQPTLFGGVDLVREWGRLAPAPTATRRVVAHHECLATRCRRWAKRCRSASGTATGAGRCPRASCRARRRCTGARPW